MELKARRGGQLLIAGMVTCTLLASSAAAQLNFEKPPISYGSAQPSDKAAELAKALEDGTRQLDYDPQHGWLPSLLAALEVPAESQTLVFSKTSLQLHKISPRTPRALYFNDDVYVGWCQRGDVIEIAATDPKYGAVFYTMDQQAGEPARMVRDRGQCLSCHATHRTQGVPGYLIRSVYPDTNGRPRSGTRTYVTDHTTAFENRFGGWYVSGSHGQARHMGNVVSLQRREPEDLDREAGANLESLDDLCDTSGYLQPGSDIVALMTLEHQTQMHNLIARASMETRIARYYDRGINEALERPLETLSPSTERRIAAAAEELIRYMLFADEIDLPAEIRGSQTFVDYFQSLGPATSDGRSFRQFDLQRRMFRYPCSYLIYSEAFDALPDEMSSFVRRRLTEVLTARTAPAGYERLGEQDRLSIVEILSETKPGYLLVPDA